MLGKITTAVAVGAGYVLGARAGRDRYESIKAQAQKVWRDPRVQDATSKAQDQASYAAARAQETAGHAAGQAAQKVKDAAPFGGDSSSTGTGGTSSTTGTAADPTLVPETELDGTWPADDVPTGDARRGGLGG